MPNQEPMIRPSNEANDRRSTDDISRDIEHTKSAIATEIKALGDKLSPEQLREGARHIIQDAKQEAKDVIRDAKDAAAESLHRAKEHAVESVTESLDEMGARARRVTNATTQFVSTHAIPLTLLGVGAAWFAYSLRRDRAQTPYRSHGRISTSHVPMRTGSRGGARDAFTLEGDYASDTAGRASAQGRHALESVREGAHDLGQRAMHGLERAQDRTRELGQRAMHELELAQGKTREFTHDNPLVVAGLAAAFGLGIGLALPVTQAENRVLGPTRDRLVRDVKGTAESAARTAKSAIGELKDAVEHPSTPRA